MSFPQRYQGSREPWTSVWATAVDAVKRSWTAVFFICADHGNAEQMIDYETGEPFTAHTTNPVPFILVNYDKAYTLREGGCLADIIPTLIRGYGDGAANGNDRKIPVNKEIRAEKGGGLCTHLWRLHRIMCKSGFTRSGCQRLRC